VLVSVHRNAAAARWFFSRARSPLSFFGVLGLAGLYARQAVKAGWPGLVGYISLSLWMVIIMGFGFVEAFILPQVAATSPALVESWMKCSTAAPAP
jgi:hypothetical protein